MLLARVAEHLYWAGRYVERAEVTARVVNEHTRVLVDLPHSVAVNWEPLLAVPGLRAEFDARYPGAEEPHVVTFLLADRANSASVLAAVTTARNNLRTTREVLPREAWEALNDLYLYVASNHADGVSRCNRGRFLDKVVSEIQRFTGIVHGTMCRDDAYQFLRLGRNVERADMVSRVLDVRAVALLASRSDPVSPSHDEVQWAAVLRSLSGLQAYCSRGLAPVSGRSTVDFLLRDPDFPSSVRHCLTEVCDVVSALPRSEASRVAARSAMRTLEALATAPQTLEHLHDDLDELQMAIAAIHDEVQATYFPPPAEPAPPVLAPSFGGTRTE